MDESVTGDIGHASYSSISKYRTCPQQWFYSNIRKLCKKDAVSVERDLGSWWHMLLGADALARGRALGSLCAVPKQLMSVDDGPTLSGEDATVSAVMDLAQSWFERQSLDAQEAWVERLGDGLPERLSAVYERYCNQWAYERGNEAPMAVELRWERPLPSRLQPRASEDASVTSVLAGYIDQVYLDLKRRIVVVRDYKTGKRLHNQTTEADMMDSQLQLYAWGAAPVVVSWGKGHIQATQYDRVRSLKPTTPVVTQSGTLSKSVTDYDVHTYMAWALGETPFTAPPTYPGRAKDGSQAGTYELELKVVEKLSTPAARSSWFQRTGPTPLNRNLINVHLLASIDSVIEMQAAHQRALLRGMAHRKLSAMGCSWCDYAELCRFEMFGGSSGDVDPAEYGLVVKDKSRR